LTPFGSVISPFGGVLSGPNRIKSRELTKKSVAIGIYRSNNPAGRFAFDPSMVFKREVALAVGGYDNDFSMGDVPLWLRMLDSRKGWEITEILYLHRVLPGSHSRNNFDGRNVRSKYAPEFLDDYLSAFGLDRDHKKNQKQHIEEPVIARYWKSMVMFELISGKYHAAISAANRIMKSGGSILFFLKEKIRASTRWFGHSYYTKKLRSVYFYRQDLDEKLLEQGYQFLDF